MLEYMLMKNKIKVSITDIEDIKFMKHYLSEEEMIFLTNTYEINYDEKTTIRQILTFFINGLKEYYINHNSGNEMLKDYFLKSRFNIIINKKYIRIYDLDMRIFMILKYLQKQEINLSFIIEPGGGFDALEQCNGIKYIMKTHEHSRHNSPHIHVCYSGEEIIVNIVSGQVIEGKMNSKKKKEAIQRIIQNKEELLLLWNTRTDGTPYIISEENFNLKI